MMSSRGHMIGVILYVISMVIPGFYLPLLCESNFCRILVMVIAIVPLFVVTHGIADIIDGYPESFQSKKK